MIRLFFGLALVLGGSFGGAESSYGADQDCYATMGKAFKRYTFNATEIYSKRPIFSRDEIEILFEAISLSQQAARADESPYFPNLQGRVEPCLFSYLRRSQTLQALSINFYNRVSTFLARAERHLIWEHFPEIAREIYSKPCVLYLNPPASEE